MMPLFRARPWLMIAIGVATVLATVAAVIVFAWPAARPAALHAAHLAAPAGRLSPSVGTSPSPACATGTPGTVAPSSGAGSCGQNQPSPAPSTSRPGATVTPPAATGGSVSSGGGGIGSGSGGGAPSPAPPPGSFQVTGLTVSQPFDLSCSGSMDTLAANFTVTVTATDQPPNDGGSLTWDDWYGTTSATPDPEFDNGSGNTAFAGATTTLTLTAVFTRTNDIPVWGFCQGLSFDQPVPGYYFIEVWAAADVHMGPNPVVKNATTYIQVS